LADVIGHGFEVVLVKRIAKIEASTRKRRRRSKALSVRGDQERGDSRRKQDEFGENGQNSDSA
jgi:hypothetical protein